MHCKSAEGGRFRERVQSPAPPVRGRRSYSSRIGAETNKMSSQRRKFLRRAIGNELTDRQRDCVQLYYGERLTMQEIADELHLTRGTVCKHLQKASARLSHALQYSALGMRAEQSRDR